MPSLLISPTLTLQLDRPRGGRSAIGKGSAWVANNDSGTISRIDSETRQIVETIEVRVVGSEVLHGGLFDVAVGEGAVWVTAFVENGVFRVDPETNEIAGDMISVGRRPLRLATGEGAIWVANSEDETVSRIDPESHQVVETIQVGTYLKGVAVGLESVWACWTADVGEGRVSRISPRTNEIVDTVNIGRGVTVDIAVGEESVWVLWIAEDYTAKVTRISLTDPRQ